MVTLLAEVEESVPSTERGCSPDSSPRLRDERRLREGLSPFPPCVSVTAWSDDRSPALLRGASSVPDWAGDWASAGPSVASTLPALGAVSAFFAVLAFAGPPTGPPDLASIAAITSLLRMRPVPVIPMLDASFWSSGSFWAARPVPREAVRGRVADAASPASEEASALFLLSTAASVRSSVVSLTKGPSQGAGFGRQRIA
ncbi:hypothetical protein GCM10009642_39820 [Nocardiopsis metallicus]